MASESAEGSWQLSVIYLKTDNSIPKLQHIINVQFSYRTKVIDEFTTATVLWDNSVQMCLPIARTLCTCGLFQFTRSWSLSYFISR